MEIATLKTMRWSMIAMTLTLWISLLRQFLSSRLCKPHSNFENYSKKKLSCHRNQSQKNFEQWLPSRWAETKRVYARSQKERQNKYEPFTELPWCIRPIFPHQAYASIFLIETEHLKGGVLLADHVGIGKVYRFL